MKQIIDKLVNYWLLQGQIDSPDEIEDARDNTE